MIQSFSEVIQNGKSICHYSSVEPKYCIKATFNQPVESKPQKDIEKTHRNNSSFHQFVTLFHMMMLRIARNRIAIYIQVFHHILCGAFIGLIFFRLANEGDRMFDHLKFCIGVIFFVVYTQIMVPVLSCKYSFHFRHKELRQFQKMLFFFYFRTTNATFVSCSSLPVRAKILSAGST